MGMIRSKKTMTAAAALCLLAGLSCSIRRSMRGDPFYESFYEQARLIMTDEEVKIYRALPNAQAKQEFIQEFWQIRDPDTSTEENETRLLFEERIEFANRWLADRTASDFRGLDSELAERYRGWNTDRGRIYVVLGPPDYINFGMGLEPIAEARLNRGDYQVWYYGRYDLAISFSRQRHGWRMGLHSEVMPVMEQARLELISQAYREEAAAPFRFKSRWANGGIELSIPATRVKFEGDEEELIAEIAVLIRIYHEERKHHTIEKTRTLRFTEEDLTYLKNIEIHFPWQPDVKGTVVFDIIARDMKSPTGSRYRSYLKKRF